MATAEKGTEEKKDMRRAVLIIEEALNGSTALATLLDEFRDKGYILGISFDVTLKSERISFFIQKEERAPTIQ